MTSARILLVDDEAVLTGLWRLVLETTGRYLVEEECSGRQVVETARTFRPDLIFMDRHLRDGDGGEIAAELRADPDLGNVPVVFITGSVTQDEAASHYYLGGMPTLAKPFESSALTRVADALLSQPWQDSASENRVAMAGYSAGR